MNVPAARAAAILAARAAKDPLRSYKPGPTQTACLRCPAMVRLLQGPNRSGKTAHMLAEFALAARRRHPTRTTTVDGIYVLVAYSREQIRDVLHAKLCRRSELAGECFDEPMIPAHEIEKEYMMGPGEPVCRGIKLKNGNRILFGLTGQKDSWKFIQGKGMILAIGVDEQAGTQRLIDESMSRLLDANNNPLVKREANGGWFMWSTSETLINDAWDRLKNLALDPEKAWPNGGPAFFSISPEENPAISAESREELRGLMSAEAYEIRMDGTGAARDSVMIYGRQWNDKRHLLPADYEPMGTDNLWLGFDPGVDHPMGAVICALLEQSPFQMIVCQAWTYKGKHLLYDLELWRRWLRGRKLAGLVYDTNLKNRDRGGGPSVLDQMKTEMIRLGMTPLNGYWQSKKNHLPGINRVRYLLDPVPGDATATPLLVVNPSQASGGKLVRWQMVKYRGREAQEFTGDGGIIKTDDEIPDCLRYLAMAKPGWNREFACGMPTMGTVPAPPPPSADEDAEQEGPEDHMTRLFRLSAQSAALRKRGAGRLRQKWR